MSNLHGNENYIRPVSASAVSPHPGTSHPGPPHAYVNSKWQQRDGETSEDEDGVPETSKLLTATAPSHSDSRHTSPPVNSHSNTLIGKRLHHGTSLEPQAQGQISGVSSAEDGRRASDLTVDMSLLGSPRVTAASSAPLNTSQAHENLTYF